MNYIETIRRWNSRVEARSLRKAWLKLRLLPRFLTSADFRLAFASGVSANQVCFERELLDHCRMVFEQPPAQGHLTSAELRVEVTQGPTLRGVQVELVPVAGEHIAELRPILATPEVRRRWRAEATFASLAFR